MANIIQTRIKLRNATLTEWNAKSSAIIQKGEVALGKITEDQIKEGSGSKYEGKESFLNKYEIRIGTSDTSTWADLEPGNLVIPADNVEGLLDKLYEYQLVKTADGKIQFQRRLPGVDTWENVGDAIAVSSQYFEGEKLTTDASDDAAITRILGTYTDKVARDGDTFVLKTKVVDGKDTEGNSTGAKYQLTAFTRDGGAWKAMDGNYDARNVYMPEDITYTTNVGYLSGISSSVTKKTWDCDGLSVFDAIKKMVSKTVEPTKSRDASYSLAAGTVTTNSGTMEMGSKVTKIAWNGTFTDAQYDLQGTKSNAGCSASYSNSIEFVDSAVKATATSTTTVDGTWNLTADKNIIIGSTSETKIATLKSDVTWAAGTYIPKNNLGDNNTSIMVGSGEDKGNTADVKVTGYYNTMYFGGITSAEYDGDKLTENPSIFRTGLSEANLGGYSTYYDKNKGNSGFTLRKDGSNTFKFVVPSGTKTVVIAYKGSKNLTGAFNDTAFNEMATAFNNNKLTITIPGYGNDAGTSYTVWFYSPPNPYGENVKLSITLS